MRISISNLVYQFSIVVLGGLFCFTSNLDAQDKSKVEKALSYKPVQRNVDYDIPAAADVKSCRIENTMTKFRKPGFVVYDKSGRILRLFFDVDRDNDLDMWAFFKEGIEVYRDIDANFDGQADQFRWMGTAGLRHGFDLDKNRTIDRWEKISASELAEEVFHCVRTADAPRFKKLLVSSAQLKELRLGSDLNKEIATSIREASTKFAAYAKSQKTITANSKWTQFGSSRPAAVPKDGNAINRDLVIFDHASAVFENGGKFGQISLGTIVEVSPNNWRLLELPETVGEGQLVQNGGLFYPAIGDLASTPEVATTDGAPQSQAMIKLFEKYDTIEKQLKTVRGDAKIATLEQQRAELYMQLATESPDKNEKKNWVRQMADTVSSSYQVDRFPKGIDFLNAQIPKLKSLGLDDEIAYLKWREIYARFSVAQSGDRRTRAKANEKYLKDLETFVDKFPKSEFTPDGLFQLGLTAEVSEDDDREAAIAFYTRCKRNFPTTDYGKKAAGAIVRLSSQGKSLPLRGTTLRNSKFDLQSAQFRGKVVVIHYWETRCDTCIDGFKDLQRLRAKYKSDLMVIGANLDDDPEVVKQYLGKNRSVNWPQLFAPGGADKSPLATQLGVATLPLTLLVDQRGKLVESNIPVADLDREIQRLIRRETGQANARNNKR